MDKERIYRQWNGKNIDGEPAELHNQFLANERANNNTSEMKYVVSVDTFSGDELMRDLES